MRYCYTLLLCLFALPAMAQDDSIHVWNKWCASKDSMLLFNGAYNLIQVYSKELKASDIKLKSMDNALRIGSPEIKGDTLSVMAMPHPELAKRMRLCIMNKKTGKTLKTITFYSEDVPEPVAQVGSIRGTEASRKELLAQHVMKVVFPGSLYCYPYQVKSFTFSMYHEKGGTTVNAKGFLITKEMIEQFANAPAGTIATFKDIKASCPDCNTRDLPDLKIKLK